MATQQLGLRPIYPDELDDSDEQLIPKCPRTHSTDDMTRENASLPQQPSTSRAISRSDIHPPAEVESPTQSRQRKRSKPEVSSRFYPSPEELSIIQEYATDPQRFQNFLTAKDQTQQEFYQIFKKFTLSHGQSAFTHSTHFSRLKATFEQSQKIGEKSAFHHIFLCKLFKVLQEAPQNLHDSSETPNLEQPQIDLNDSTSLEETKESALSRKSDLIIIHLEGRSSDTELLCDKLRKKSVFFDINDSPRLDQVVQSLRLSNAHYTSDSQVDKSVIMNFERQLREGSVEAFDIKVPSMSLHFIISSLHSQKIPFQDLLYDQLQCYAKKITCSFIPPSVDQPHSSFDIPPLPPPPPPSSRSSSFNAPPSLPSCSSLLSSSSTSSLDKLFFSQEVIGKAIFEKFRNSFKHFDAFTFLIVTPNRTDLSQQTMERLGQFMVQGMIYESEEKTKTDWPGISNLDDAKQLVCQPVSTTAKTSNPNKMVFEAFAQSCYKNPTVIHLIIWDECHWGIRKGGQIDQFLGSLFDVTKRPPNVFFLLISATLENVIIAAEPDNALHSSNAISASTISWRQCIKDYNDQNPEKRVPDDYFGIEKYRTSSGLIESDNFFTSKSVRNEQIRSFLKRNCPFLLHNHSRNPTNLLIIYMIAQYCAAIVTEFSSGPAPSIESSLTQGSLSLEAIKLLKENKLIVVRLPNVLLMNIFHSNLKKVRQRVGASFEVLRNTAENKILFGDLTPKSQMHLSKNRGQQYAPDTPLNFNDLKGIPSILLIVDAARMGATFPEGSFSVFDLRARYIVRGSLPLQSSFLQDVGRAFGYGQRPVLFLSKVAKQLLLTKGCGPQRMMPGPHVEASKYNPPDAFDPEEGAEDGDENEEDSVSSMIKHLQQNYNATSANMHKGNALRKTVLLWAEPQIGKTGAFLSFLDLLHKEYRYHLLQQLDVLEPSPDFCSGEGELMRIHTEWHTISTDQYMTLMQTPEGKELHRRYHLLCDKYAQGVRKQPWEYAVNEIENFLEENEPTLLADFGCGQARLACHFKENRPSVTVTNIDGCYPELARINLEALRIDILIANTADTPLKSSSYDYVTICGALYGSDYERILIEALRILKPRGRIIIVDYPSSFSMNMDHLTKSLRTVGNVETKEVEGHDTFKTKFIVMTIIKRVKQNKLESALPLKKITK